jgi:ferredoxin-NADP reductase
LDETASTKRFFFQIPSMERFDFEPGQFVTLDLPIHEQKNKRWRSYSIASAPNGTNEFELVIVKMEGGKRYFLAVGKRPCGQRNNPARALWVSLFYPK